VKNINEDIAFQKGQMTLADIKFKEEQKKKTDEAIKREFARQKIEKLKAEREKAEKVTLDSVADSFGNGFNDFFTDQYDSIKSEITGCVSDPLGTYAEFYGTPSNYIKLFPVVDMWKGNITNAYSGIQTIASGDINAMSYRLGNKFGCRRRGCRSLWCR